MRKLLVLVGAVVLFACGDDDPAEPEQSLFFPSRYVLVSVDGDPLPTVVRAAAGEPRVTITQDTLELTGGTDPFSVRHHYYAERQVVGVSGWVSETGTLTATGGFRIAPEQLAVAGTLRVLANNGLEVTSGATAEYGSRRYVYRRVSP